MVKVVADAAEEVFLFSCSAAANGGCIIQRSLPVCPQARRRRSAGGTQSDCRSTVRLSIGRRRRLPPVATGRHRWLTDGLNSVPAPLPTTPTTTRYRYRPVIGAKQKHRSSLPAAMIPWELASRSKWGTQRHVCHCLATVFKLQRDTASGKLHQSMQNAHPAIHFLH